MKNEMNLIALERNKLEEEYKYITMKNNVARAKQETMASLEEVTYEKLVEKEIEVARVETLAPKVSRGEAREFTATAYDLTVNSCGKLPSHPYYGITASGFNLQGHTVESARAIAVDPKVIPMGSKVYIEFLDEKYKWLDGEFTAVDTGSAIKGKIIDIFFGDTGNVRNELVWEFGRRKVKVIILEDK